MHSVHRCMGNYIIGADYGEVSVLHRGSGWGTIIKCNRAVAAR